VTNLGYKGSARKNEFVNSGFRYHLRRISAMPIRTRIFSFVSAVAFVLVAPACGGDSVVDPVDAVAGNYDLTTANGQLPFRFVHNDTTVDITSGTLALRKGATFQEVLRYHVTPPSPKAPYDTPAITDGTFSLDGSNITFTYVPTGGQPYSWGGTVGVGTVTYTDPIFTDIPGGLTAVYTKQ
jgi:hypothetical protein